MKLLLLLISAAPLALAAPAGAQSMQNMPGMNMPASQPAAKRKPAAKPASRAKRTTAERPAARPAPAKRRAPAAKPKPAAHDMSGMGDMPGMDMPASKTPSAADAHAGHDMSSMPGMAMPESAGGAMDHTMPGMNMPAGTNGQPMEHDMSSMPGMMMDGQMAGHGAGGTSLAPGNAPAPSPPSDHYADRIYQNGAMADSRSMLHNEHGGSTSSMILFNLAEYQVRNGRDGYRWDGEAWFGKDLDRLTIKTEGEGVLAGRNGIFMETAEVQALYSRALDPYWNVQAGVRYDFKPNPSRTYATIGIEGVAPYWFETEAAVFLSNKGEVLGRIEGYYDQRITQRLILQPRVELNFSAQDVPETRIGAGISNAEFGLRLRYEVRREFAPYIGVSYDRQLGKTADYARADGEGVKATSFVIGVRTWF
ncbi:copper resistance protein B [Sphingomonas montanisoli]|uniref:Copper resistance protein B n=1 Tax=Sphingomonas montanisoli TaxID=2606412 RepID=A0A5D9BYC4_9SPHN|nr:copper resistance protein B [Sphingomonas montanisoli]TZG24424.1 copper resistance protein B [Sphingomonas montanisoli]